MSSRAGKGLLGVDDSEQLGQIAGRLEALDTELRTRIDEASQQVVQSAWQEELAKPAGSRVQRAVILSGSQIAAVSGGLVVVSTGQGATPLSGGLVPGEYARAFEFGALDPQGHIGQARYPSRRGYSGMRQGPARIQRGGTYPRHTQRQMPTRSQTGWIAYPAAARLGKRLAQLLQQTVVKFTHDAIDGGR